MPPSLAVRQSRLLPPKPLTPDMQREVDAIVVRPKRLSPSGFAPAPSPLSPVRLAPAPASITTPLTGSRSKAPAPSSDATQASPPSQMQMQYVRSTMMQHSGKDTEDHFEGHGMRLSADKVADPDAMPFDAVYSMAHADKDTADHFSGGMVLDASAENTVRMSRGKQQGTSEFINDRAVTFDTVYGSQHVDKDTADHFGSGFDMAGDDEQIELEARQAATLKAYSEAKARMQLAPPVAMATMGHEQQEGRGDTEDHFDSYGGMSLAPSANAKIGFEGVYDSRHDGFDARDHFEDGGLRLAAEADSGTPFDRVFGTEYEGADTESHFKAYTMGIDSLGDENSLDRVRQKRYPALSKAEMVPPPRAKFLHAPRPKPTPSPAMQAEMDQLVVKGTSPSSHDKFAWNSERIAHELVVKLDRYTRRREDHMRKIMCGIGCDPEFESPDPRNKAITVSPKNFNRVCDRFGVVCNEQQATEIFRAHKMDPVRGCNLYTLAKNFLHTQDDTLARKQQRLNPAYVARARAFASAPRDDAFRLARLPDLAWKDHRAATAPAPAGALPHL